MDIDTESIVKNFKELNKLLENWTEEYKKAISKAPERKKKFENPSEIPLKPIYTPLDIRGNIYSHYVNNVGFPGLYPFTRGVYPTMYRSRLWTKRLLTAFGSPEQANERIKLMLKAGETGINIPAPSISMRGMDTDEAAEKLDKGYIGLYGANFDTLKDIEILLDGIPIHKISVNYSDPAPFVTIALHFAFAKRKGIPWSEIRGTTNQADCYSHWASCWDFILFPLEAHLNLTLDHFEWCAKNAPRWWPLSIIGQHNSQAGATPVQEVAFTLAAGIDYVKRLVEKGMTADLAAQKISAFFDGQINLFEMAAKLRAARRIWARIMKEEFKAKNPRSWQLRMHVQTSGVELTRQQVLNNIVRVTLQALGAVLGGANSLHTDSFDEALCIPSEKAQIIALMTQHILSEESGVADVIDPLGGSYYVEWLTDEIEQRALEYIYKIEEMGGMLEALRKGFIQREIAKSAYDLQKKIENKERIIVGVNEFVIEEEEPEIEYPKPNSELVERQIERTKGIRKERDLQKVESSLDKLKEIASGNKEGNIFQQVINCVNVYCTRGEIVGALREIFGEGRPKIYLP
ncbi:methylmalonyl-CoA mutase [Archaeoglobales archaeon]|nr:MAG: methylmalonyl-CoA mutase [Archaeoglobales archaeon]